MKDKKVPKRQQHIKKKTMNQTYEVLVVISAQIPHVNRTTLVSNYQLSLNDKSLSKKCTNTRLKIRGNIRLLQRSSTFSTGPMFLCHFHFSMQHEWPQIECMSAGACKKFTELKIVRFCVGNIKDTKYCRDQALRG